MKKILAILAFGLAGTAFADSFSLERHNVNNVTGADQTLYAVSVKRDLNKAMAVDVGLNQTQTDGTSALGTRLEAGLTGTMPLFANVKGYVRGAVGQRYSNGADFTYYSVEPGVTAPVGPFTARVGWRYRTADNAVANNDQTHTMRYSLAYALTKQDSVALGYDRVTGDSDQKNVRLVYTRSF